jgi:outer membrane receptor protein involved in Fe transport
VTSNNPHIRPLGDGFFNDVTRGYTQQAAYTSVDFDLIPSTLTLTAGTRYFRTDNTEVGSAVGSFGCSKFISNPAAPNPCVNSTGIININSEGLERAFSGFKSRANLSWKASDDALLYYTWSQGFRAGGFNRSAFICRCGSPLSPGQGDWQTQAREHGGWAPPIAYAPDSLVNNELGWKTKWMDQRIQWNGAIYQEDWNHAQIGVGSPGVLSDGLTLNGGNYRVRGVETSGVARVTSGLTIEAHVAWNQSELVKPAIFLWADGIPIDFSALETMNRRKLSNPGGVLGSPLAGAPPFQGNVRARYEFAFNGYEAFAQLVGAHQSHSLATTDQLSRDLQGNSIAYDLPAFTTYDAALGIEKGAWIMQVYGENLTDTQAELYANYAQWYRGTTVNRPRTIGVRLSYKFGRS